jgi:hypothetical protein
LAGGRVQSEKDGTEEISKAFQLFDKDGKGKITFRDLKRVAAELGENMSDEQVRAATAVHELTRRKWSRSPVPPATASCPRRAFS